MTKGGNLNSLLVLKWPKNIPSALFLLISFTNVLFSGPRLWNVLCTRYSLSTSHQSPDKRLFSQSVSLHLSFAIYLVNGHSFRVSSLMCMSTVSELWSAPSFLLLFFLHVIKLKSVKARYINLLVLSALVQKWCTYDLQMNQSIRDKLGFAVPDIICLKL